MRIRRATASSLGASIAVLCTLMLIGCGGSSSNSNTDAPQLACGTTMDATRFADADQLQAMMSKVVGFGELRTTGSESQKQVINWVESKLNEIEGMQVRSDSFPIQRWQPTPENPDGPGRSLALAGRLTVGGKTIPVAGAVPYSQNTGESGLEGELVFLSGATPITDQQAGKIIVREFPAYSTTPAPINDQIAPLYAALAANALYLSPEMFPRLTQRYERPYLASTLHRDLIAAGQAGVAGIVFTFDVPRDQVAGYFDPHDGVHYRLPALFLGVDEGVELKVSAQAGERATITVLAQSDTTNTRNLIATLPGLSDERIVLFTHTDGNTWVQENGVAGILALARYFGEQPLHCRPRTLEFNFTTGHLHMSRDGGNRNAQQLDAVYDDDKLAFVMALEHLGTREIEAVAREGGAPGRELVFTGRGESTSWFVPENHPLFARTSIDAIQRHELDSTLALLGVDQAGSQTPSHCSFGGLGTQTHARLIPTIAMISGPWSLWAPSFGEDAVDFDRMRAQLLAMGDALVALDDKPIEELAGPYPNWRALREDNPASSCSSRPFGQPEQAPGPG